MYSNDSLISILSNHIKESNQENYQYHLNDSQFSKYQIRKKSHIAKYLFIIGKRFIDDVIIKAIKRIKTIKYSYN